MRCMILYLIAALMIGIAVGSVCTLMTMRMLYKKSKRKMPDSDPVAKCFLDILRH